MARSDAAQPVRNYAIHLNSSMLYDEPAEDLTFLVGRSLGLLYTFEPSDRPYLVIPRAYQALVSKEFVLGFITENEATNSAQAALSVQFMKLPSTCAVFENYDNFELDLSESVPSTVTYQFNPEVGAPATMQGASINCKEDHTRAHGGLGRMKSFAASHSGSSPMGSPRNGGADIVGRTTDDDP